GHGRGWLGAPRELRVARQLRHERSQVEWVVADPLGDLLTRGTRAFPEQLAEHLGGLRAWPPLVADALPHVRAQLGRADPGAKVVGRVEAGVHVGDEPVGAA